MNRKIEDELMKLAFEEMTPEQASELSQIAASDPEAQRTLTDYQDIKRSLRMLADVPPHQLSNERLRSAILGQGLKPARKRFSLGWASMPLSAAALAVVFMAIKPKPPVEPMVALHQKENLFPVPTITAPPSRFALKTPAANTALPSIVPQPTPTVMKSTVAFHRSVRHHSHKIDDRVALVSGDENGSLDGDIRFAMNQADKQVKSPVTSASPLVANPSAAPAATVAENKPAAIVLIDGQKDGNTGASRATEVDSTSNVVVGG